MNTKKKRFALKKRLIKHFLALTLAGSLLLPGLVLIRSERVEANIIADMAGGVVGKLRYNATVAEIIISLLAGNGTAVTNTSYLNKINSSYGVNSTLATATRTDGTIGAMMDAGLFSIADDGTFIDNGLLSAIESQPAYTQCNIDSIMGTWNDSHTAIETTAATNLGGAIGAGTAIGTVCQVAGAFMVGFNLGNLAVNFVDQYHQKMATKQALEAVTSNVDVPSGYYYQFGCNGSSSSYYTALFVPNSCYCYWVEARNYPGEYTIYVFNPSNNNATFRWARNTSRYPTSLTNTFTVPAHSYSSVSATVPIRAQGNIGMDGNESQLTNTNNYINDGVANGTIPSPVYSPDVIGRSGNQRPSSFSNTQNPENWPDIGNQLPEGKGITVIPWDDYMDFVNDANTNSNQGNTTINQGDTYNNFIENYYVTPETTVNPDIDNPGINNPTVETVTSPDYNPTVPEQPTPNPKEELTTEEIQDTTDYMTTPGLKDVFPFSIPWDIAGLFNIFSTDNRAAPVITFPIKSNLFGIDEEVTIDLTPFDGIASLLRLLELIGFGIGLAFVTRYLIGAGG